MFKFILKKHLTTFAPEIAETLRNNKAEDHQQCVSYMYKNVTNHSNIFIKFISIGKFSIYILPNSTPPPYNYLRPPIYEILFLYQPLTIISIPLKYIKDQPSNLLYPLESIMFITIF